MIRLRRRLLLDTALLGAGLTMLVLIADRAGWLTSLELWAYDRRARDCQFFTPPPTTQLVHLDIDDRALEILGQWPWPRSEFAALLDELRLAGPKAVALDIIYPEPEKPHYVPVSGGGFGVGLLNLLGLNGQGAVTLAKAMYGDLQLAAALQRLNNVIVAVDASLSDPATATPAARGLRDELTAHPEATEQQLIDRLVARGIPATEAAREIAQDFYQVRRQAVFDRIAAVSHGEPLSLQAVRDAVVPRTASELDVNSPVSQVVEEQYIRYTATLAAQHLAGAKAAAAVPLTTGEGLQFVPIAAFSNASVGVGFVSFGFFEGGTVRSMPMGLNIDGTLYPQFGLALACRMLDVAPSQLRFTENSVIIPQRDGRDITIPTYTRRSRLLDRDVRAVTNIPWFGTSSWETMYDYPKHVAPAQHVPLGLLWDVGDTRRRIARHDEAMDAALISVNSMSHSDDRAVAYAANRPPPEDVASRLGPVEAAVRDPDVKSYVELIQSGDTKDLAPDVARFLASAKALPAMLEQAKLLRDQLQSQRTQLAQLLGGKAVLVGWTATGAAADFVPTSLHAKCPGVVVHGAIFNAIMTRHFWRRAPQAVTIAITIFLGLVTAFAASALSPLRAALVAVLLLAGYLVVNGILLLDYCGIIVGVGTPMVTIAVVWSVCTLVRIIAEGKERALITKRFSNYADRMLVDYVIEHPEQVKFDGQRKELTVVFTDLQGFTTLSEKLGEKSVLLLNEYMGVMVPIIGRNLGYVNKFLGDGIMFFFGAPWDRKDHAAVALKTVLEMQEAMVPFNERLAAAGLPLLVMRAGISTGEMIVGDAGSANRSDYTVLGDAVNLGARLESGNKAIGTRMLASARAKDLGGEALLLRPVGSFCYLGKSEGVATYEVVGRAAEATPRQLRLAELSKELVEAFAAAKFEQCVTVLGRIEAEFGPDKLTKLYREWVEKYLSEGPPVGFCGNIVLSEK